MYDIWTLQQEELIHKWLDYNAETGIVKWRRPKQGLKRLTCDTKDATGYLKVRVCGVTYLVHRVAWFLHTGRQPMGLIDHINRIRDDNRIENLRLTCHTGNALNTVPAEGYGIYILNSGKYATKCCGKYLGSFSTREEAKQAYLTHKNFIMEKTL